MDQAHSVVVESLPAIDIAVGADRLLFLERIAAMSADGQRIAVERHQLAISGDEAHFINFILPDSIGSLKSGGQLIAYPDEQRVRVEMYSIEWTAGRPTKAAYIEFAKEIFNPIIREYNYRYGTHHRLHIAKVKAYDMPPKTKLLFNRFANLANVRSMHTLDWTRFYFFIQNSRSEIPECYLRRLLMEKGFSLDKAEMMAEIYHHLRRFKILRSRGEL